MKTDRIAVHATFVDLSSARNYSVPGIGISCGRSCGIRFESKEVPPSGKIFIFFHDNSNSSTAPGFKVVTRILINSERFEHRKYGK